MMKILLTLFCYCLTFCAGAFTVLPPELDGTMMPYDFAAADSVTPASITRLEPVGTAYIARHGARYLSSEKKVEKLLQAVGKAREKGTLTEEGEAFSHLLDTVINISRGRWGDLSAVGAAEEAQLGTEYCSVLSPLSENLKGSAVSSYVPRVVRTMWDFLYPLAANSAANELTSAEGPQFSPLVRFFDTDSVYHRYIKEGDWKEAYARFAEETLPTEPARRLFGNIGDKKFLQDVSLAMYGVLQSFRAVGLPAPTTRWMTVGEYRSCWEATNLQHYLQRSLCSLSNDAMIAASPLLQDIVAKTDLIAEGRSGVNANFWFGHAETLLPLTALMGLPGCAALPLDWPQLADLWKDYEVTPLGANILVVLLKDPEDGTLRAAVRLNGRWVEPVGGEGLTPLWEEVRGLWLRRVAQIGSGVLD